MFDLFSFENVLLHFLCVFELLFCGKHFYFRWKSNHFSFLNIYNWVWIFFSGSLKLHDGPKYIISERSINSYTWQMNLTIKSLQKNDFGEYTCTSVNALGKHEARIRLQGECSKCTILWQMLQNKINTCSYCNWKQLAKII